MMEALIPHPSAPPVLVAGVEASVLRPMPGLLCARFEIIAPEGALFIPERAAAERRDELWRTTCVEAFVLPASEEGESNYVELNVSPSTRWAAYGFDSYREAMAPLPIETPKILVELRDDRLVVNFEADLSGVEALGQDIAWMVGLSAVIVEMDGAKSFWALRHAHETPDFHDASCFTRFLPPPEDA